MGQQEQAGPATQRCGLEGMAEQMHLAQTVSYVQPLARGKAAQPGTVTHQRSRPGQGQMQSSVSPGLALKPGVRRSSGCRVTFWNGHKE